MEEGGILGSRSKQRVGSGFDSEGWLVTGELAVECRYWNMAVEGEGRVEVG